MTRRASLDAPGARALALCALVLALPAGVALADEPAATAAPEERWRQLTPAERQQVRERYRRYQALPAEQRRLVQQRLTRWKGLTPEERTRIRERYKTFRSLTPERRMQLHRNYRRWRQLTPAQQQQLRKRFERFNKLTPEQRRRLFNRHRKRR